VGKHHASGAGVAQGIEKLNDVVVVRKPVESDASDCGTNVRTIVPADLTMVSGPPSDWVVAPAVACSDERLSAPRRALYSWVTIRQEDDHSPLYGEHKFRRIR
jgi:hypothetical protein